mmetsp:Transcript_8923/g.19639  ORF Transcript_8923/g.19639 Transcript_8923/m.19639 type:complete len:127 (-) Transcript_8923:549-929(-)
MVGKNDKLVGEIIREISDEGGKGTERYRRREVWVNMSLCIMSTCRYDVKDGDLKVGVYGDRQILHIEMQEETCGVLENTCIFLVSYVLGVLVSGLLGHSISFVVFLIQDIVLSLYESEIGYLDYAG